MTSDLIETWKDIPEYEGYYQVSDLGRVKSFARRVSHGTKTTELILKPYQQQSGHLRVTLYNGHKHKKFLVHNLVLLAFKGERPDKRPDTRHLNGDPSDNRLDNLTYGTAKENYDDAVRHGTLRRPKGSKHHHAKLSEEQTKEIIGREDDSKILAKEYGVNKGVINMIRRRKSWSWLTDGLEIICPTRKTSSYLRGDRHPQAKLTEKQAMEIRKRSGPGRLLAAEYGISKSVVDGIRSGRIWKHLPK